MPQLRMELIELPHLSVGSPPKIAPPRVSQVEMRDLLETARRVKAGSQLVGERLVVDEAVCACRHDGALVQVHGIERASLDTGNLCAYQRCTIFEVLRTIRCPGLKLLPVSRQRFSLLHARGWSHRLAQCGARERGIEMILGLLRRKERHERGCRIPCFRLVSGVDC